MKCIKPNSPSIFVVLMGLLCASATFAGGKEMEEIQQLAAAAGKGPETLLAYVQQTRIKAPVIYSQWYVDGLAKKDPKRAELEQARREFGRKLLESLEATAAAQLTTLTATARQQAADTLLDLADWFGKQPGYGNAILFNRLQDMATVPLAYLIADLSYPEAKIAASLDRLVGYPDDREFNVRSLNQEAPQGIFSVPARPSNEAASQRPLTYNEKSRMARKQSDAESASLEIGWYKKFHEIGKWQKEHGKPVNLMPRGKKERDELPEELAFFADDETPSFPQKPLTALTLWERKCHRRLSLGLGGHNIKHVKAFFLFRQKIGSFPTTPPAWWKPGDDSDPTPAEAAFSTAWGDLGIEYGPKYSPAAQVFNAVRSNTFYDQDTANTKSYEERVRAEEALKRDDQTRRANEAAKSAAVK